MRNKSQVSLALTIGKHALPLTPGLDHQHGPHIIYIAWYDSSHCKQLLQRTSLVYYMLRSSLERPRAHCDCEQPTSKNSDCHDRFTLIHCRTSILIHMPICQYNRSTVLRLPPLIACIGLE